MPFVWRQDESVGEYQALPVVLNHIFSNYDEEHLKLAIHWLKNQPRQIFINTTDKKEKEFLEKEKIEYKENPAVKYAAGFLYGIFGILKEP